MEVKKTSMESSHTFSGLFFFFLSFFPSCFQNDGRDGIRIHKMAQCRTARTLYNIKRCQTAAITVQGRRRGMSLDEALVAVGISSGLMDGGGRTEV
jgi:hypothetical protein